jgi:fibronectin type 3 domain-containing protein
MRIKIEWVARALVVTLVAAAALAATPGAAMAADTTAPTQPGAITVSSVTATSAALKWGPSSDAVGIEGYRVYRALGSATPTSLIATTDAVSSYSATRLYSGKTYTFGIVAIDAANNKSAMRTATVTTLSSSDTTAPTAPSSTSVSFRVFSSSRVDVVFGTSSSTDVAGYRVLRNGAVVGTVDLPNTPRFSDNGLAAATSYSYMIQAVDSAGNVSAGTTAKTAKTLATGSVIIARGPYLSKVTSTASIISWWTNVATTGTVAIAGQTITDPAGSVQHHAVSVSGLSPGSSNAYTVTSGTATASGTLTTAASPGQTFSFATIGDFGGGSSGETQNAANIASAGTQFIQTLGDNIYPSSGLPDPNFSTTYSDFDQRFFKPFAVPIRSQAFFPANGNKEYYGDGEFWDTFPMPGSNHSWYSYNWGNAHILVLDSEQPFATGSEQYNFAQADLAANQAAQWRIVALQRPPYSSTTATSSSKAAQQYLVPLFQAQHVQLVLSGNSHNYERTFPLINGVAATGGVTYVVSGAGGNGFNAFSGTAPAYSAFRESSYFQFAKVTVSPTALTVDAVRADGNTVFDTTTINAAGGDTTAPSAPAGLQVGTATASSVPLSWTANAAGDGVTSYNVYRGSTKVGSSSGTSFSDTGLSASTTYSYTVTAVDAAGNESPHSSSVSATTAASGSTDTSPPSVPSGVNVTAVGSSELDVKWTASTDTVGVTGYHVYRDGATAAVATVSSGVSYKDTGLTAASTHSYTVSAFDAAGNESAKSAAVTGTTGAGGGTTSTVLAKDDATISKLAANTGTNYGSATTLTVDGDGNVNDFLLNFAIPAACTPTAASLTLTVGGGSTNSSTHGGDFYAAPGTWSEGTVTATSAPTTTGTAVSLGTVAVNTAYSVDVTSLLGAGVTNGVLSIRATTTSNDAAAYVSKNASNGSTAGPKLALTCG